jgi:hypothetical protein
MDLEETVGGCGRDLTASGWGPVAGCCEYAVDLFVP